MTDTREYEATWRNKFLTLHVKSLDEMIEVLQGAVDRLREMRADGVTLDPAGGTGDDYARLVTTDAKVADKYGMEFDPYGLEEDGPEDDPEDE